MATLADIGNFWATRAGAQYERWLGACLKAAYDVLNEDPGTENHADRLTWANVILGGDDAATAAKVYAHMKYAIASNATIQGNPDGASDNDIQFVVNSQLNTLAG
jgi:hypothetical protein